MLLVDRTVGHRHRAHLQPLHESRHLTMRRPCYLGLVTLLAGMTAAPTGADGNVLDSDVGGDQAATAGQFPKLHRRSDHHHRRCQQVPGHHLAG